MHVNRPNTGVCPFTVGFRNMQGAPIKKNNPLEKKCCNSATVVRIRAKCSDFVHDYSRNLFCKFYSNGYDGSTDTAL